MHNLVMVDIDNTLFDSASRLTDWFPLYNPLGQKSYKFADERLLKSFEEPTFYNSRHINESVLSELRLYKSLGFHIGFYSLSPNQEVVRAKVKMLSEVCRSIGVESLDFTSFLNEDLKRSPYIELDFFKRRVSFYGVENVLFIDDAPHRLGQFSKMGWNYLTVEHPYNKGLHDRSKSKSTLLPNYYRGWGYEY